MAPRKKTGEEDDDSASTTKLFNIANLGMGYYNKFTKVVQVSDVSLKLVGSAFSPAYGLKGNVWLAKYHTSKNKAIRKMFMPKKTQRDPGADLQNPRKSSNPVGGPTVTWRPHGSWASA